MYRVEAILTNGMIVRSKYPVDDREAAESVIDALKAGMQHAISFWDDDGAYIAMNGQHIVAIQAKEE